MISVSCDKNAQSIKDKPVDAPLAGDNGKVLTYDHANGKYKHTTVGGGFPAPDYESAWVSIANNVTYDFEHFLDQQILMVAVFVADSATPADQIYQYHTSWFNGDEKWIQFQTANVTRVRNDTGDTRYFKLLAWKW